MSPEEIDAKLDGLETDMERLVAENHRLIQERISSYVELDFCVSLMAKLAVKNGFTAGIIPGNYVVIDLPVGQVSFEFAEAEAHLFSELPPYEKPVEEIDTQEKYRRVMNPGL